MHGHQVQQRGRMLVRRAGSARAQDGPPRVDDLGLHEQIADTTVTLLSFPSLGSSRLGQESKRDQRRGPAVVYQPATAPVTRFLDQLIFWK